MVAGEPNKGINDPVVEELPWHPLNSGGREASSQTLKTVSAVLSSIIQRTRRFIHGEKFAD